MENEKKVSKYGLPIKELTREECLANQAANLRAVHVRLSPDEAHDLYELVTARKRELELTTKGHTSPEWHRLSNVKAKLLADDPNYREYLAMLDLLA